MIFNPLRFFLLALFCGVFVFLPLSLKADVPLYGIPEVENYNRRDYQAGTQNWSLSQAANGLLYSANNDGVLEYDGNNWRLLPKIGDVIVRSVLAHEDKIYMGTYNNFGYYERNDRNDFEFHSLAIGENLRFLGDVWEIIPFNDLIVFQADKGLVLYKHGETPTLVPAKSRIPNAFLANGMLLVYDEERGLMELRQGELYEVPGGDMFAGISIGAILPISSREILVATITEGLYLWDLKSFSPWKAPATDFLKNANVFCGKVYDGQELVFGTIQSGVVVTDLQGNITMMTNKDRGLINNTVLSLEVDMEGNIWTGLDNGISRISFNSTVSFIQGYYDIGTGYALEDHEDNIYLGTNQALYFIEKEDFENPVKDREDFLRIPGTSGQVWSLFVDKEGQLLCGHNSGIFSVKGDEASLITPGSVVGAWLFRYPPGRDDILLVGSYNGILLLKKENNQWVFKKRLEGFDESARFMEWDSSGGLWVTHGYLGTFRLFFNEDYDAIVNVESFKEARGLDKGIFLNVSMVNREVVFSSKFGIFGYDNSSESFYRHQLNSFFMESGFPILLRDDENMNIWFFTENSVGVLRRLEDGSYTKVTGPFYAINGLIVNGFEFVKVLNERNALFGVEDGFAHYSVNEQKDFLQPFNVHIRGFKNQFETTEYLYSDHDAEQVVVPQWPFNKNAFEVTYSATHFESSQILFSTYIEGMDKGWSDFVATQRRQFTNIREGEYVFWVKALNIHGVETEPVGFRFEVLPPWYRTVYARIAYAVVVVLLLVGIWFLLIWLMERSRMVELKKQQERFRSKEEKLRNAALENEKEMIRLRNEKLRNEMVFKEKELANSTMHVIQKNDFLLNIKEELQKINRSREVSAVERKVNEIVRKIDRDIDNESQWEVFELHLEHVHADFLNRLQKQFPDLSSREQKLCAYLRMDMASKEISSLMNISVRAVENNRYKLRKKMGLDAKDNLSDFIMNI
ncbi:helix-turn-helix and ligand-binding sensor domain-containing protein [Geofilum rubicundum]|uniref:HTH luxR-type domain-containing protein n=1 Tax=Geofilum rubicundum JCM 15548 TaxID=1236989 RepID=A0A0E9LU71_9BACT|nr:hypothetical protein [Geofilum rubicundum]GAO28814.1 hypothetical protein JCM15548_1945 [Geofilum rubicundum JCM 15548]